MLVFSLITCYSFSQDYSKLPEYNFNNPEDFKEMEPKVLECANYLFDHSTIENETNRNYALQFILLWMQGTPDYTFSLDKNTMELTKGNNDLLAMYMAGMTKVVLDNRDQDLNSDQIYEKTEALLIDYCSDPANKLKPSRKMKKIVKSGSK